MVKNLQMCQMGGRLSSENVYLTLHFLGVLGLRFMHTGLLLPFHFAMLSMQSANVPFQLEPLDTLPGFRHITTFHKAWQRRQMTGGQANCEKHLTQIPR